MHFLKLLMALTIAGLAANAAAQTADEPIIGKQQPAEGTGHAGDLFRDTSAVVTFVSVLVSLVGIVFVGLAGKLKEGELDEAAKKKAVAEFDFKKGMLVALFSGMMPM